MPARDSCGAARVLRCSRGWTVRSAFGCQNSSFRDRVEVTGASLFGMSCISALVVSCCDAGLLALREAALVTNAPHKRAAAMA